MHLDSENRPRRDNLVKLAAKLPGIAVTGNDWDTQPWLFGVENGVIDLKTGTHRAGEPGDRITKVAPVRYDPKAKCPRWDRFLKEIFADHVEHADYFQRVMGYALTGVTTEQVFWVLWGNGANGKSTLMEVLMRGVFGDAYSWTMPFPSIGWSNAMSEYQKASLVGQRLIAANEVSRRGELNEELIKSLTGDDTVNARHPYGRPFQFVPVAKFFLRVNDKPVIRDQSHGMWRRVKLVPFTQTFQPDRTLAGTLMAEASGILSWAVRGCVEWHRDGLRHPDSVEEATKEYQAESDPISDFIVEKCVTAPNAKVGAKPLFEAYQEWCAEHQVEDVDRLSQRAFGTRMKARFQAKESATVTYHGIGLRAEERSGGRRCDR